MLYEEKKSILTELWYLNYRDFINTRIQSESEQSSAT